MHCEERFLRKEQIFQDKLAERDADLDELETLGEASRDDQVRLQATFNRLRYLNLDGDYPQAILAAERGLSLLESSPALHKNSNQLSEAQSRLLTQIGFAYYFLGKPLEALGFLDKAWNLCEELEAPEELGRILHILGYVYFHLTDFAGALDCQQKAYANHAKTGEHNQMVWALIDIGAMYKYLGDLDNALRSLEQGLELCSSLGSQRAKAYGFVQYGSLDLYRGDYAAALSHYTQAGEIQQAAHSRNIMASAEEGMGTAFYHLGDFALSSQSLERALQIARTTGLRRWAAGSLLRLGLLDIAEQHLVLARQHLEEGFAIAQDCQSGEYLVAGSALLARLERLGGNFTCALDWAAQTSESARQIGLPGLEMFGELELGLAYLSQGNQDLALKHTRRAVNLVPKASQEWIGREEPHFAHAIVLRATNQEQDSCHQEISAREVIQSKADLISDPSQRSRYLSKIDQNPLTTPHKSLVL